MVLFSRVQVSSNVLTARRSVIAEFLVVAWAALKPQKPQEIARSHQKNLPLTGRQYLTNSPYFL
jgi:hypothetical protein